MKNVFINIETTGLNPSKNKIIEISALKVDSETRKKELFHQILNPGININKQILKLLDYEKSLFKKQQKFEEIADEFLDFVEGTTIVGFNNQFIFSFINRELSKAGHKKIKNKNIDLYKLSIKRFPKEINTVDFLTRAFNINYNKIENKTFFEVVVLEEIFKKIY